MSFIYDRTISIRRPAKQTGVGIQKYGGETIAEETVIEDCVPASVQQKRESTRDVSGVPSTGKAGNWRIYFNLPNGKVQSRDIIVDDLGIRYQVLMPYWTRLGYNCSCERLEV